MRIRKGIEVALHGLLVASIASQSPPPDPLANVLAAFPDDGLPALLAALEQRTAQLSTMAALAALGPAAHEALLGRLLQATAPDRATMLPAFAGFDARAAWALPLLVHPTNLPDPTVQELLVRLGPAATPAIALLRGLPSPQRETFAPLAERLLRASDAPTAAPFVARPRVAAEHVPALLERLRAGPTAARWPALQALLTTNDEAVVDAVWVLAELEFDPTAGVQATALRAAVRCVYGARRLPGVQPLDGVRGDDRIVEFRRVALAGALCHAEVSSGSSAPDPTVQALQFLRNVQMRPVVAGTSPGRDGLFAPEGASPWLANLRVVLQRARREAGKEKARQTLELLQPGAPSATVQTALDDLRGIDLGDAPDEFWQRLLSLAIAETGASPGRGSTATTFLSRLESQPGSLPRTLVARLVDLGIPDPTAHGKRDLCQRLVTAAGGEALAEQLRKSSENPAELARWLTFLAAADRFANKDWVAGLRDSLAGQVATLPAVAQVAWFRLGGTDELPASVWTTVFTDPDVGVRQRAIAAAWRGDPKGEVAPVQFALCLRDVDDAVATQAAHYLGLNRKYTVAAVALLVEHCADARPVVRAAILRALGWQKDHAVVAARPAVDAAFACDDWRVRLQASVVLLTFEPEHAAAWTAFAGYLEDVRREVVEAAWNEAGNRRELAERCVDLALARLQRPGVVDSQEGYAVVRVLGAAPSASARTLPVLEDLRKRVPQSQAGQRAQGAIEALQRAAK